MRSQQRQQALIEAAELYREAGKIAKLHQKAGWINDYENAISIYRQLGEWVEAGETCREAEIYSLAARFFERGQAWDKAACDWERIGRLDEAKCCWEKASRRDDVDRCEVKKGIRESKLNQAAEYYEKRGEWFKAARYWFLAGDKDREAKCSAKGRAQEYEQNEKFVEAAAEWTKAGEWERAAKCWERTERWESAAQSWEKVCNWDKAIECWGKSEHKEKDFHIQRCTALSKGTTDPAGAQQILNEIKARQFQDEAIWDAAAENWECIGKWEEAAKCWQKAEEWGKAAECWERVGDKNAADRCMELASLKDRIGQISS